MWDLHTKKTGTSQRIFLPDEAINIINLMREQYYGDLVFPLPELATILRHLKQWAKDAGVLDFTFHTARHTWASLNATVNPMLYLKEGLGHSSIATTQIYSHLQPGQKIQSVKKFSDYLAQARKVYEERQKFGN